MTLSIKTWGGQLAWIREAGEKAERMDNAATEGILFLER